MAERSFDLTRLGFAITVGAVVVTLPCLFVRPYFETDDDFGMIFRVAGSMLHDRPDEHMIFSHVFIGRLLKWLYSEFPSRPWYELLQFFVLGLAGAAIFAVFRSATNAVPPKMRGIVATTTAAIACVPSALSLQFTKTAFVAATAGVVLALGKTDRRFPAVVSGAGLFLLGFMLRAHAAMIAATLVVPALGAAAIIASGFRITKVHRRTAGTIAAVFGLALGLRIYDRHVYLSDPAWRDYFEFSDLRAQFNDRFRVQYNEATKPAFDAVGWSKNDFDMMMAWFPGDETVYSKENLRSLVKAAADAEPPFVRAPATDLLVGVLDATRGAFFLLFTIGAALLAVSRRTVAPSFVVMGSTAALCVFFAAYFHLPPRVFLPMLTATAVVLMLLNWSAAPSSMPRSLLVRTSILGTVVCALGLPFTFSAESASRSAKTEAAKATLQLFSPKVDEIFYWWSGASDFSALISPFESPEHYRNLRVLGIGWGTRSPLTADFRRRLGLDDFVKATYEDPRVKLIIDERLQGILSTFLWEHYGVHVVFEERFRPFLIYQATRVK